MPAPAMSIADCLRAWGRWHRPEVHPGDFDPADWRRLLSLGDEVRRAILAPPMIRDGDPALRAASAMIRTFERAAPTCCDVSTKEELAGRRMALKQCQRRTREVRKAGLPTVGPDEPTAVVVYVGRELERLRKTPFGWA